MSEPGEPDARDWFRGVRPAEAVRAPSPVGEAFRHLRKADGDPDAAGEPESAWFAAHQDSAVSPVVADEPAASAPDEAQVPAPSETTPATPTEPPALETDGRVRLQALTGGLADLSDALAAIGVQSVALRSTTPARPSAPPPDAPPRAADFRVRCPDCGPQLVAIADLRFVETGDGAEANRYLFTCPSCNARVRRPAGPELAEILKSSGVATLALRRGPGQAL